MDNIYVINKVIEKAAEYTKPSYMALTDYKNAFESVLTAAVFEARKELGTADTYIRILEDIYKKCTGRMSLHK